MFCCSELVGIRLEVGGGRGVRANFPSFRWVNPHLDWEIQGQACRSPRLAFYRGALHSAGETVCLEAHNRIGKVRKKKLKREKSLAIECYRVLSLQKMLQQEMSLLGTPGGLSR